MDFFIEFFNCFNYYYKTNIFRVRIKYQEAKLFTLNGIDVKLNCNSNEI